VDKLDARSEVNPVKHRLAPFVLALVIALAATGTALTGAATAAATDIAIRLHSVVGSGLLSDPNIPLYCPTASPLQPVSFSAAGRSDTFDARGSMSLNTVELADGSCTRITLNVSVDCLLVVNSEAVLFGHVTSIVPPPRESIGLFAAAVRDNGLTGDKGKLIPLNIPPPASCAQANLPLYFGFGFWPFTSGGVTVS
jgi:hypothetical protein